MHELKFSLTKQKYYASQFTQILNTSEKFQEVTLNDRIAGAQFQFLSLYNHCAITAYFEYMFKLRNM